MATNPDVAVIGGGIIGLTSAYLLARAGQRVVVFDRGELGREASWAGAGIIPPGNPDRAATPIDRLRAIGSRRFPTFSAELRELTGIDNGYLRCGGIEFLAEPDLDVLALWRAEGIVVEQLIDGQLPGIAVPFQTTGFALPDCAQVRNPWHLRALIAACQHLGVELRPNACVLGWKFAEDRIMGLQLADDSVRSAAHYLITAGAWTEALLSPLNCAPGVVPVRGQIVLYHPASPLFSQVLMVGKRYLVPRPDGRVLVGSTEEPEAGFAKKTTPEAIQSLREFAERLVPALAQTAIEHAWAGLRPGSPDGRPFIGPVPGFPNVLAAVGHFRAGVQLSIGTAELVRDLVLGRTPEVDQTAFRLDRPPDLELQSAFRS